MGIGKDFYSLSWYFHWIPMGILLDFHGVSMESLWPFLWQFCGISLASGILLGFLLDCHVSLVTLVFLYHF